MITRPYHTMDHDGGEHDRSACQQTNRQHNLKREAPPSVDRHTKLNTKENVHMSINQTSDASTSGAGNWDVADSHLLPFAPPVRGPVHSYCRSCEDANSQAALSSVSSLDPINAM